ncbi:SLC13 family permease [Desulfitobacterium chlororespirans]|uniref:Di-and tricarboxylate transporter n=1 Tax=Desulfitobacterium chlororespirans DSM 11544 TaxID=1121395 RepID=A0A1M7S3M8_9FIRM|nr:SLC13 family permease [Desulfitobacterium chlororespirans]SHN53269.1 Di-and tricarboxylate transporter [Desulfitobacterium chlororespirans DSM 11544]
MAVNVNTPKFNNVALTKYYVHIAVFAFLLFGFSIVVPPIEPITAMGMKILGVFLGTVYAWLFIDVLWPSLISMVVLGFTGYAKIGRIFAEGFGSDIFLTLFFIFIFAAYLEETGINRYFATWLITRKFVVGKPWRLIAMIFVAAYLIATVMGVYAAILVLWTIVYNIAETVGLKRKDRLLGFILVGIANVVMLGWGVFPFTPFPLQGLTLLAKSTGVDVNLGVYLLYMIPISVITLVAYLLGGKYIFKLDTKALENCDYTLNLKIEPLTKEQRIAILFTIVFVLALFAPQVVPKSTAVGAFLAQLPNPAIISIILVVICLIKNKSNEHLTSFQRLATSGSNWRILILMACTVPLGNALEIKEAGLMQALTNSLAPILSNLSPFVFYALSFLIAIVITQFVHNVVLLTIMTPILTTLAVSIGANPVIVTMGLILAIMAAIATPGASSRAALVFGNTEWIATRDAYIFGIWAVVSGYLVVLACGIPWGMLLF